MIELEQMEEKKRESNSTKSAEKSVPEQQATTPARALIKEQLESKKNILKVVNLQQLPDGGERLTSQISVLEEKLTALNLKSSERSKPSTTHPSEVQTVKTNLNPNAPPYRPFSLWKSNGQQQQQHQHQSHPKNLQFQKSTSLLAKSVIPSNGSQKPGLNPPSVVSANHSAQSKCTSAAVNSGANAIQVLGLTQASAKPLTINSGGQRQIKNYFPASRLPPHIWKQLYAAKPQPQTLYGGRMTKTRMDEVKSVTTGAIEHLHKALLTRPSETEEVADPPDLTIPLLQHQRQALAWMLWREKQEPSGGILADDMGLGKTLTILALTLKRRELSVVQDDDIKNDENVQSVGNGGTLIICPASIIQQWQKEIEKRVSSGALRFLLHHGSNRGKYSDTFASYDVVITSYETVRSEIGISDDPEKNANCSLLKILWEAVVLDEAHNIKNHKCKTALAVCQLRAKSRWAMTGTPVHNDLLDMFSLLRFIRCSPFDELKVWKKWVDNKSADSQKRLKTLVRSLMLRRTKSQTNAAGKPLVTLPSKREHTHLLKLSPDERRIYDQVFKISQESMEEYLKQQEKKLEKDEAIANEVTQTATTDDTQTASTDDTQTASTDDTQAASTDDTKAASTDDTQAASTDDTQAASTDDTQAASTDDTKAPSTKRALRAADFLVLLLRLRQCCCHLSLIRTEDNAGAKKGGNEEDVQEQVDFANDLVDQMSNLCLTEKKLDEDSKPNEDSKPGPSCPVKSIINSIPEDTVYFNVKTPSSKMDALFKELDKIHRTRNDDAETSKASGFKAAVKSIIVSQWTSVLNIIECHLKDRGFKCHVVSGEVKFNHRTECIEDFNNNPKGAPILLLSLRAGGVGLNLVGGSHLFLFDVHWNPQLEAQACDRIYRVGQVNDVHIHKFLCENTVEDKIVQLQQKKLRLAENVLAGGKGSATRLTLDDMKMLFGVK